MTSPNSKRKTQRAGVWGAIKDGRWHDLWDFKARAKGSDSALTARIRELRRKEFGKHVVECRRFEGGVYRYRLVK